jgi:hypothetical protein
MVVAHATVLRLTASPPESPIAGGTERRPSHGFSKSQGCLKLAGGVAQHAGSPPAVIREEPCEWEGNTSRKGMFPPRRRPT